MPIALHDVNIPAAVRGLREGVDPALPDHLYSPLESPDMENVRVVTGKWQTRLGYLTWKRIASATECRLLDNFYGATVARTRLGGLGTGNAGKFYYYREGTDSSFQLASGGTSIGATIGSGFWEPYWHGTTLNDRYYFTDRSGALRRFEVVPSSGNQVRSVAQPVAPGTAPSVKPRTYAYLEDWTSLGSWASSSGADISIADSTAAVPSPLAGGNTVVIAPGASPANQTITENVANETLNSHTIAFWATSGTNRFRYNFEFGTNAAGEHMVGVAPLVKSEWFPVFIPVADLPTISYKRFRCVKSTTQSLWLSALCLPGRLEGQYRWIYTHYDSATGRESAPSPQSNSGTPLDFSAIGVTNKVETGRAFQKAAAITVTSDAGADSTTNKIRIYRNGGVPALTKDSRGIDVWLRVGEIFDQATTLNGAISAAATSFVVTAATNLVVGDALVLESGVGGKEEIVIIKVLAGTTVTPAQPVIYAHANGVAIQLALVDNVANEAIDVTAWIDIERNDPPAASKWCQKAPDGRLWLFNVTGKPTGICVSNRSSPTRLEDYEVFPDAVDPLTRRSLTQGWRFEINGDANDEEIMWGGFFRGYATVLTRKNLYLITANSQADWGPSAIVKVHQVGCIQGETVVDCNGVLYWVADGPRVMRWDGIGLPQEVSHLRVNERLNAAPTADWKYWFAAYHVKSEGAYYMLYYQTSNVLVTGPDKRLDYNITADVWEPQQYNCSCFGYPSAVSWKRASVRDGASDARELYQADDDGVIYQMETGSTDDSNPIRVKITTKKFPLAALCLLHHFFLRLTPTGTDTVTLTVRTGGSEYLNQTQAYTLTLTAGNDQEIKQRLHKTLLGRWAQVQLDADVNNRPGFREMVLRFLPVREGRRSA